MADVNEQEKVLKYIHKLKDRDLVRAEEEIYIYLHIRNIYI